MKPLLLPFALLLLSLAALHAAPPPAGNYTGVFRATKTLSPGGPAVTTTLRVVARVAEDGSIVVLPAIPQSPSSAANPTSAASRLTPNANGTYTLEGGFEAGVSFDGSLLKIRVVNAPEEDPNQLGPAAVGPRSTLDFVLLRR